MALPLRLPPESIRKPLPVSLLSEKPPLESSESKQAAKPRNLPGMLLMTFSTLCQVAMQATIRSVPAGIHPVEIAFFRNLFGLSFLLLLHGRKGLSIFKTKQPRLHAVRGLLNVVAMMMFFTGVTMAPLSDVAAISFTAPLFASLLAIPLLGERLQAFRAPAFVAGFVGMFLILRPGWNIISLGALLILGASLFWSVTLIVIKVLTRTDSPVTITIYMGIYLTPLSLMAAIPLWQTPGLEQLAWMALIGAIGTLAQISLVQSFRIAEATAVLPMDFFKLIWSSVLGYLLFAEIPSGWSWAGGSIIFVSTTFLAFKEARSKR